MCSEMKLELLTQLPLEPSLAQALDNGEDFFEVCIAFAVIITFSEISRVCIS